MDLIRGHDKGSIRVYRSLGFRAFRVYGVGVYKGFIGF